MNSRIEKELKTIENYCFYYNKEELKFTFNTTHGLLNININSNYPFSPPKINIISNLEKVKENNYEINYYLNKLFPEDIKDKIINNLHFSYKNETIHIKKYFYECFNKNKINNIIDDFDNLLIRWSPIKNIKTILEFLENTNKLYNIKKQNEFIFITL